MPPNAIVNKTSGPGMGGGIILTLEVGVKAVGILGGKASKWAMVISVCVLEEKL